MIEIYQVNPILYSMAAGASFLFIAGAYLIMKTTGKRYLGLSSVALSAVLFFYVFSALLLPIFPVLKYVEYIVSIGLAVALVIFTAVEFAIIKDAFIKASQPVDYLIVHGAKVMGSIPSPSLQDRLDGTLVYLKKFPQCKAVLTGTKWPWGDMSEAQCMQNWLIDRGIASERLILEEKARNTVDNLRYSGKTIFEIEGDNQPVIGILTSEYHMHRALYLAKLLNMPVIGVPVKTTKVSVRINYFIREFFAMMEIFVFGVKHK